jgi:nicotinamidase/pyrazinamidase
MAGTLFWDVDTQVDFVHPSGALYVPGAEVIVANLEKLTQHAIRMGLDRAGSVDLHDPDEPDTTDRADLPGHFPPHCVAGTPGAAKIAATAPQNPLWVPSNPVPAPALAAQIRNHRGEVLLQKHRFDVFSNPNACTVLRAFGPSRIVVYGVALDVGVRHAVEGFLTLSGWDVWLVEDAVRAAQPESAPELLEGWRRRGVTTIGTDEVLDRTRQGVA